MKRSLSLYAVAILVTIFALSSCAQEESAPGQAPVVVLSKSENFIIPLSERLLIEATVSIGENVTHSWSVDQTVYSTTPKLDYTFEKSGTYAILYIAKNEVGEYKKEFTVTVTAPVREKDENSNIYVTTLFEYCPAPGQFINKAPGNIESAQALAGAKGMVTLGSWGGYVVYGFDHTVANAADTVDIIIYNNASSTGAEPGIVWVMQDQNGNGKPDDTWYELAGSEFGKEGYKRAYTVSYSRPEAIEMDITWRDGDNIEGVVKRNNFHRQAYYPLWIEASSYTLSGSWLAGKIDKSNANFVKSTPYEWGYADNTPGGDKLDIANAVDQSGQRVELTGIDFIKVQTGVMGDMGWLGELSTEVCGIADLSMVE